MSRYASSHLSPQGPGDARPTAMQVLEDEGMEGKLKGKGIVITGCSSGLGVETARVLSKTGATLYLTARNLTKAKGALSGILEPGRVELVEMDNTSLDSVRSAASTILQKSNNQVNILINNAGVMAIETLEYTKDGYELQFGTNHLSHFLLFQLLKPALLASSTPELHSRVVNLTSSLHRFQSINDSDNYNFQKGDYKPWSAYGQSKTANLYMSNEIERRYGSRGLHATAVHPGIILTPLHQHVDDGTKAAMASDENLPKTFKNEEQGAATTICAAIGKEWEDKGGKFLEDCAEATRGEDGYNFGGSGFVSHSYDPEREARLWKDSLAMVGVKDDA